MLAEVGRPEAPTGDRPAGRAGKPRGEDHREADDDRRAGHLYEKRRGHRVGVVGGGFNRRVGRDRRDELPLAHLSAQHHQNAREHEAPADPHQRASPISPGQVHRQRVEQEHEDRQPYRQRMQRFRQIAHQPKLTGGDHLQVRDRRRQLSGDARGQTEPLAQIGHDLAQVERDRAAVDLHARSSAVDDPDERLVGRVVCPLPHVLNPRGRQGPLGAFFCQAVQRSRDRPGERPELLGQARLQFALHVDVRVQLVDQVAGHGCADRRLLQQGRARLRPVGRVQQLPVGPDREDGKDGEQRGDHENHAHPDAPSAARRRDVRDRLDAQSRRAACGTRVRRDARFALAAILTCLGDVLGHRSRSLTCRCATRSRSRFTRSIRPDRRQSGTHPHPRPR